MVHVDVVSQPVKPCLERPSLPTIAADRLPCFEKDLLGQVFGVRMAAGTAIQILVDTLYEEIVEFAEGASRDATTRSTSATTIASPGRTFDLLGSTARASMLDRVNASSSIGSVGRLALT